MRILGVVLRVGLMCGAVLVSLASGTSGKESGSNAGSAGADKTGAAGTTHSSLPFAAAELEAKLKAGIGEGNLFKRGDLEVRSWSESGITVRFRFKPGHIEAELPEIAGMGIATLTVKSLLEAGYNPHEHWTMIHVWVEQTAGPSVTGAPQVRSFGEAMYDFSKDKVTYEAEGE